MASEIRTEVASVKDRVLARAIDLWVVLQFLLLAFFFLAITGGDGELALFQTVLLGVIGFPAMDVMCTFMTGTTPGKRARGLGVSYGARAVPSAAVYPLDHQDASCLLRRAAAALVHMAARFLGTPAARRRDRHLGPQGRRDTGIRCPSPCPIGHHRRPLMIRPTDEPPKWALDRDHPGGTHRGLDLPPRGAPAWNWLRAMARYQASGMLEWYA